MPKRNHTRCTPLSTGRRRLSSLLLTLLLMLQATALFANVELVRFEATAQLDNTIKVEWETASELNTVAFRLFRNETGATGSWGEPIFTAPAEDAAGHTYTYVDANVTSGVLYYYRLEDIDQAGAVTSHGPAAAGLGVVNTPTPTRTATAPQAAPTAQPGIQPTATRQFTNTPPPAATPLPGNPTAVLPPTSLPVATATPLGPAQVTTPTPIGGLAPIPTLAAPTIFVVVTPEVPTATPQPTPTTAIIAQVTPTTAPSATPHLQAPATPAVFEAVGTRPGVAPTASTGATTEVAGRSMGTTLAIAAVALVLAGGIGAAVYFLTRTRQ